MSNLYEINNNIYVNNTLHNTHTFTLNHISKINVCSFRIMAKHTKHKATTTTTYELFNVNFVFMFSQFVVSIKVFCKMNKQIICFRSVK